MMGAQVKLMAKLVLVLGAALVAIGGLFASPPRRALAGAECAAAINGQDVSLHASAAKAIDLHKDDDILLALVSATSVGEVEVRIEAGPWRSEFKPTASRAQGTAWSGIATLEDYARFGVGLYHVTLTSSGGCSLGAWINVTGSSPFTTPVGGTATGGLVLGLLAQIGGLVRGARSGRGVWWSLIGGIPSGLGACVLSQQAGLTPITSTWALVWTAPSVSVGGVLQLGLSLVRSVTREAAPSVGPAAGDGGPQPAMAEPPAADGGPQPAMAEPPAADGGPQPAMAEPPAADGGPQPAMAEPPAADGGPQPAMAEPSAADGGPQPAMAEPPAAGARPTRGTREGPTDERDPPRTAYARLTCPEAVIAGVEFELVVGMAPEATPGVSGGSLVRPPTSIGPYELTVQVVADGFTLGQGEAWRHALPVTAAAPYPSFSLHLTAAPQSEQVRARAIQAIYSCGGQSMGFAVRPVAVARSAELLGATAATPADDGGLILNVPTDEPVADLTVRIQRGDSESDGRLLWTFDTPHKNLRLPDAPVASDIGEEPEKFARQLVDGVGVHEGQPGLYAYLLGVGLTISDQVPSEFWSLLRSAGREALLQGRRPTVFILSEEPYVPWELATLESPIDPDPAVPPFLGAQASVGRWVLGQRRPKLPPPFDVAVKSMAVISGEYAQPGWNRLLEAEQEAAALAQTYGAVSVQARTDAILECLASASKPEALHFAVHGVYDPNSVMNGLVLIDGLTLDPLQVKGCSLTSAPFVFLNACQVGSANKVLGDYGGMAEAFLYAGAAGVIAPLWSIKDTIAREIALRFYEEAFAGTPPAEVLRRERTGFSAASGPGSATCLAYVWYGHPSLRLSRLT